MGSRNTSASGRALGSVITRGRWVTESHKQALSSLPFLLVALAQRANIQEIPACVHLRCWIILLCATTQNDPVWSKLGVRKSKNCNFVVCSIHTVFLSASTAIFASLLCCVRELLLSVNTPGSKSSSSSAFREQNHSATLGMSKAFLVHTIFSEMALCKKIVSKCFLLTLPFFVLFFSMSSL